MANVGPLELGIVLVIVLLLFGPKRLPEVVQSLGRGVREFKDAVSGEEDGVDPAESPRELKPSEVAQPVQGEMVTHNVTPENKA